MMTSLDHILLALDVLVSFSVLLGLGFSIYRWSIVREADIQGEDSFRLRVWTQDEERGEGASRWNDSSLLLEA